MSPRGKRPASIDDDSTGNSDLQIGRDLTQLARSIKNDLSNPVANETIQLCGSSPLEILSSCPAAALDLAHEKLHSWPYHDVLKHWRRLYEDASFFLVASLIEQHATTAPREANQAKRTKVEESTVVDEWLATVVALLDKANIIAGAPGRRELVDSILQELARVYLQSDLASEPQRLNIHDLPQLKIKHPTSRAATALSLEDFQTHVDQQSTPLIVPNSFEHWAARQNWSDLSYLMRSTLNGHRLIPVEIGNSYTDADWTQRLMTFSEFVTQFLLPEQPDEIGYIAQHDLSAQIPALKNDFSVPDFCFTAPKPVNGAAAQTCGLSSAPLLDEPLMNAWLGPKGTKTPPHTDPYHNILCQVVGYKYVRLYAPEETYRLYPQGVDENGVDMANTSQVSTDCFRPTFQKRGLHCDDRHDLYEKYPLLGEAVYQEAVLAPGECLYIPLGWWHYVESLTTSFSVSFWWN